MKIHEIQFTNFRAFESFRMDFDPQATVIVGRNGTGKSTILDGIAIALGPFVAFIRGPDEDAALRGSDARLVVSEQAGVATTESKFPIIIEARGEASWYGPIHSVRDLAHAESLRETLEPWHGPGFLDAGRELSRKIERGESVTLPLVAYYRTMRLWENGLSNSSGASVTPDNLMSRLWGYRDALIAGTDRKGFEEWMAWRDADRMQRIAFAVQDGKDWRDVKSPQLEAVANAAAMCLEGAKRFYYNANHRELRVDFNNGPPIPFRILSDGQKNIVAMAADIAWRAAQLNPHLGSNVAAETPGIVLIDELDLHLHPAWQMRVLDDLMRAFPKVQFIVTTHSPQIMAAAPPNSVRLLDMGHAAHRVDRLRGRDTNSILEDILGVPSRPPQWKEKLERLARLIEDESLDDADCLLKELEQDEFYLDDPDIVSARWEIALARGAHAQD